MKKIIKKYTMVPWKQNTKRYKLEVSIWDRPLILFTQNCWVGKDGKYSQIVYVNQHEYTLNKNQALTNISIMCYVMTLVLQHPSTQDTDRRTWPGAWTPLSCWKRPSRDCTSWGCSGGTTSSRNSWCPSIEALLRASWHTVCVCGTPAQWLRGKSSRGS